MSGESPLQNVLVTMFSQGVATDWEALDRYLNHPRFPTRATGFKRELADAILNHTISPKEFERLTVIDTVYGQAGISSWESVFSVKVNVGP
jgi:hypothetical protein